VPLRIVEALKKSDIVKEVASVSFDGIGNYYRFKARVRLINGWLMDVWEHRTPELRRYSYHVFSGRRLIVRWDNAPHYKDVPTFPHHKHIGEKVEPSEEMNVESVLREIRKILDSAADRPLRT